MTGGEALLAILIAWKGPSLARRLRGESRRVRRNGLRYKALRGAAKSVDSAVDDPVAVAKAIARVARSRRPQRSVQRQYWN